MSSREKIKLIIWGTGGQAGGMINYNKAWLFNVHIVCFISNNHQVGTKEQFYQKDVRSPEELYDLEYDYILILSSYVEEITEQILNELKISGEKIISLETLAKKVVEQTGKSIFRKIVLLYGKKYTDFNYIYHVQHRAGELRVVIDGDNEKAAGISEIGIKDVQEADYDYVLLLDRDDAEREVLCHNLEANGVVIGNKVLGIHQWIANLAYEYQIGNSASKQIYYAVVPRPNDGLMGLLMEFLRLCDYAGERGYIPFIDMQNAFNFYLEEDEFGRENSWEKFYSQTLCVGNKTVAEIYQKERVIIPSMFIKVNRCRDIVREKASRDTMRSLYHRYFSVRDDVRKIVDEKYAEIFKEVKGRPVLGCIYRGTDYVRIRPANHMVQPDLDEFIEVCSQRQREWGCDFVFLATEDDDALEKCKEHFKDRLLYTDQLRYRNTGSKFLAQIHNSRARDRYLRGIEYLTAIMLLAKTDYLVSGQNGGLDGVLLLKEDEFKNMYIFDKGKYAWSNDKYV